MENCDFGEKGKAVKGAMSTSLHLSSATHTSQPEGNTLISDGQENSPDAERRMR
jgi:hypothetical protein